LALKIPCALGDLCSTLLGGIPQIPDRIDTAVPEAMEVQLNLDNYAAHKTLRRNR
jgi:hypothetical protein